MADLNLLLKPLEEQAYIAYSTHSADILDILSNSNSTLVKMTVLANPCVSEETLKRKIDDEDPKVWHKAQELLSKHKK